MPENVVDPPITLKTLRQKIAKQRRWFIWMLGQIASIEGQATHRIDELLRIERRLDERIEAERTQAGEPSA